MGKSVLGRFWRKFAAGVALFYVVNIRHPGPLSNIQVITGRSKPVQSIAGGYY
jgi:hypothetical protein